VTVDTKRIVQNAVKGIPRVRYFRRWDDKAIAGKLGTFAPRFVMVHGTAGTNSRGILESGAGHVPVPGSNFLVNRDGSLDVQTHRMSYHAGTGGPFRGVPRNRMNPVSWGIEFETLQRKKDLTVAQIATGAKLIAGLLRETGLGLDDIIQHKEWNPKGKPHDTLYSTAWWREQVKPYMNVRESEMVVKAPAPLKATHSGKIGATAMTKTPVDSPVEIPGGVWVTMAVITLPDTGEYSVSMQVRSPVGSGAGRVQLVRLAWPGNPQKEDSTGHNPTAPATVVGNETHRWNTPIQGHVMAGGGPLAFQYMLPKGVHKPVRAVCKAVKITP
jgi:hypothetical protein